MGGGQHDGEHHPVENEIAKRVTDLSAIYIQRPGSKLVLLLFFYIFICTGVADASPPKEEYCICEQDEAAHRKAASVRNLMFQVRTFIPAS